MRRSAWLIYLVVLLVPAGISAQTTDQPEQVTDLAITNVYLIGRQDAASDVLVNVLIRDGKLLVVTENELPENAARTRVDGQKGFLFGRLEIGKPARVVILDTDPRADISVLVDSAKHSRFALQDNEIVLNELPTTTLAPDAPATPRSWRAYTPPPIAVPTQYFDSRKWNRFDTRYASGLVTGALVLDRLEWLSQDSASKAQVGNLKSSEGSEVRAFRLGVVGRIKFPNPWTYTIFAATHTFDTDFNAETDDDLTWFDYRLDIPVGKKLNLSVGKQKEPISMERLMPLTFLPWQERAAVNDSLLQARNFGVVLNSTGPEQRWAWAASVFRDLDAEASWADTPTKFAGRTTVLPWVSEDGSNLVHLGLGIRYTDQSDERRYRARPEFNRAPLFLDTGAFDVDGELTTNLEVYWRRGPYLVGMEFTRSALDAPAAGNPTFDGFFISGSWSLTGEMRNYRRTSGVFSPIRVARPVNRGGWGSWELAARYSNLDLTDGGIDGGEMEIFSLGLNWWLTQSAQASLNYRYVDLDRFDLTGQSSGIDLRLLLVLD